MPESIHIGLPTNVEFTGGPDATKKKHGIVTLSSKMAGVVEQEDVGKWDIRAKDGKGPPPGSDVPVSNGKVGPAAPAAKGGGNNTPVAKGKGPAPKGAGKGPPPASAPKGDAGPPKGKGKAAPGFAPNMKKQLPPDGNLGIWQLVGSAVKAQNEDGSVPPKAFFQSLTKSYGWNDLKAETAKTLLDQDEVFCTAVLLAALEVMLKSDFFSRSRETKVVTKMGDGRGKDAEVKIETGTLGVADLLEMLSTSCPSDLHGKQFMSKAESWLAANTGDGQQDAAGRLWTTSHVGEMHLGRSNNVKQVSEEARREKELAQRRKSQAGAEKRAKCVAHWLSLSPAPITDVQWSTCKQTMHAGGGSGGCLLVELEGERAICLKPQGMMTVAEFLAESMFRAVGIRVAACRVVAWTEDEFHSISEHVLKAPVMFEGQEANVRQVITGMAIEGDDLGIEYVGVLEFVPGFGLMGMPANQALAGSDAATIYAGMGAISAMDVLINNLDRVPLPVWNNDGNLSNVMVSNGETIAIDQQVNLVIEGPGLDRYLARVRELVEDVKAGGKSKAAAMVKQALMENTGTDAPEESLALTIAELSKTLTRVGDLWRSGALKKAIDDAEAAAMVKFDLSETDVGQTRVEAMAAFLRRSAAEVASAVCGPEA